MLHIIIITNYNLQWLTLLSFITINTLFQHRYTFIVYKSYNAHLMVQKVFKLEGIQNTQQSTVVQSLITVIFYLRYYVKKFKKKPSTLMLILINVKYIFRHYNK